MNNQSSEPFDWPSFGCGCIVGFLAVVSLIAMAYWTVEGFGG